MQPDLLHAAGPRKQLFGLSQSWENGQNFSTVEGPYVIRHGSLYYLFYSGNDWSGNYAMGYATSRSPLGPFAKCSCNPVLRGTKEILGPGGGSIVQGPDNADWLVFHAWDDGGVEGYQPGGIRNMLLEPITWRGTRAVVARPTNAPQRAP
jgi:beta-xylosidase